MELTQPDSVGDSRIARWAASEVSSVSAWAGVKAIGVRLAASASDCATAVLREVAVLQVAAGPEAAGVVARGLLQPDHHLQRRAVRTGAVGVDPRLQLGDPGRGHRLGDPPERHGVRRSGACRRRFGGHDGESRQGDEADHQGWAHQYPR